jgi:hypothetical protein
VKTWRIEEKSIVGLGEERWTVVSGGYTDRDAAVSDYEHLCPRNREWRIVELAPEAATGAA